MTRKTKTIEVEKIRDAANKTFRDSVNEFKTSRAAIKLFVEDILMKTGNYKGFRYLAKDEMAEGKTFGIRWAHDDTPIFEDQTRVAFL
jgi:hypothetical protein